MSDHINYTLTILCNNVLFTEQMSLSFEENIELKLVARRVGWQALLPTGCFFIDVVRKKEDSDDEDDEKEIPNFSRTPFVTELLNRVGNLAWPNERAPSRVTDWIQHFKNLDRGWVVLHYVYQQHITNEIRGYFQHYSFVNDSLRTMFSSHLFPQCLFPVAPLEHVPMPLIFPIGFESPIASSRRSEKEIEFSDMVSHCCERSKNIIFFVNPRSGERTAYRQMISNGKTKSLDENLQRWCQDHSLMIPGRMGEVNNFISQSGKLTILNDLRNVPAEKKIAFNRHGKHYIETTRGIIFDGDEDGYFLAKCRLVDGNEKELTEEMIAWCLDHDILPPPARMIYRKGFSPPRIN